MRGLVSSSAQGHMEGHVTWHFAKMRTSFSHAVRLIQVRPRTNGLHLLGVTPCPFVQRIQFALAHLGQPYHYQEIDLGSLEERKYLDSLTPYGRLPVLLHENHVLWESAAIVQYVDDCFAGEHLRLMGTSADVRSFQRSWTHFANTRIATCMWDLLFADPEHVPELLKRVQIAFREFDSAVAIHGGPFVAGTRIGFTDIMIAPLLQRRKLLEHFKVGWQLILDLIVD